MPRSKTCGITDVAAKAGVSPATVSLALNGKPGVASRTRHRVLQVAKELNYRPNASARSLVLQKTGTLGVIVPDIGSPFYAELVRGIEEEAAIQGYCLIICTTSGWPSREEMYCRLLNERRVDGLVLATPRGEDSFIHGIYDSGFPLVVVDRDVRAQDNVPEVIVDNFHGALSAVQHLLRSGYRRIGFISGIPEIQASQDRLRGYQVALAENNVPFDPSWVAIGDFHEKGGYLGMKQLLSVRPLVEAVFAANDLMAIGAIRAIRESGLLVPTDIAVVGFDDIPLASQVDPPLTTVRQPIAEMGAVAVKLLVRLIQGEAILQRKVILQTELVLRASTPPRTTGG